MEHEKQESTAEPVYKPYVDGNILYNMSFVGLFGLWAVSYFVALPIQVNTIMTSTLIIFLASHRSLRLLDHNAIPLEEKETLSEKDAYKFPIFGSISLFGLYAAFKYLDKDTVNLVLACYFSIVGVFTLTGTFAPFAKLFIKSDKTFGFKKTFPVIGDVDARLNSAEIVCMILSIVFSWFYFKTKHYMMNNVLGISLCIQAIERISIGSYKIGAILLVGLFFYDIFWVFGTDVMVTVAKSFDGPIKLLFPKVLPSGDVKGQFSLLGLGDIVIPGIFIAMLMRYDAVRAHVNPVNAENKAFPKPYFMINIVAYALGLLLTVIVMFFFDAAQPALLYLVPMCLGASILTALVLRDTKGLFAYDEEAANAAAKEKQDKEKLEKDQLASAGEDKKIK